MIMMLTISQYSLHFYSGHNNQGNNIIELSIDFFFFFFFQNYARANFVSVPTLVCLSLTVATHCGSS